jgi:hypothetical protein
MTANAISFRILLARVVLLCSLFVAGCGGLPDDFETLSLEKQVAAYEQHFANRGVPIEAARYDIAWHGWEAADLMAEYVTGKRSGLPTLEAIKIIRRVQWRGCSLQGTAAESALENYLSTAEPGSLELMAAEGTLRAIRAGVSGEEFLGGPCQEGREGTEGEQ